MWTRTSGLDEAARGVARGLSVVDLELRLLAQGVRRGGPHFLRDGAHGLRVHPELFDHRRRLDAHGFRQQARDAVERGLEVLEDGRALVDLEDLHGDADGEEVGAGDVEEREAPVGVLVDEGVLLAVEDDGGLKVRADLVDEALDGLRGRLPALGEGLARDGPPPAHEVVEVQQPPEVGAVVEGHEFIGRLQFPYQRVIGHVHQLGHGHGQAVSAKCRR